MGWREDLLEKQAQTAAWMKAQEGRFQHTAADLETKGREVYARAARTGQKVVAQTPAELRALGLAAVQGKLPQAAADIVVKKVAPAVVATTQRAANDVRSKLGASGSRQPEQAVVQAKRQARAAASGFVDEVTLGLADRALSASNALVEGGITGFGDRYADEMAKKRAEDAFDARHYGLARSAGQVAGTAAGLAALGPADALLAGGVRMAKAAPLVLREVGAIGGAGGLGGVVSQGVEDLQRGKLGTVGDYVGSAAGGAATALASTRLGPGQAGAVGGAVTSVAQDALNGRRVSWENVRHAALGGGYLAAPFGLGGRAYSEGLSAADKGKLGEQLGRIRTRANGGRPEPGGRRVELPSGRTTVLDQGIEHHADQRTEVWSSGQAYTRSAGGLRALRP